MRSLSYANNKVADQPAHLRSLGQRHMLAVDLIVLHVCLLYSKTLAGLCRKPPKYHEKTSLMHMRTTKAQDDQRVCCLRL